MSHKDEADRWTELMLRGDFAAAWKISDELLQRVRNQDHRSTPRHEQNVWDGTSVDGKRVLLRCYHGLGDTIQFIRYAAPLKTLAAEVIVWMQPTLIPLLGGVKGIDRVLPLHDGAPDVEYDVDLELNELSYLFRTTLETIPAGVPYVQVEPAPLAATDLFRVGLIWRSGDWDERRSISFEALCPLAAVEGIEWHILQRHADKAGWDRKLGILSGGHNPLDDARLMRALDLVISVDTMTAHLAGALGRNTWTLLSHDSDWRWMRDRQDSPWYPTMRLFRQKRAGKWDDVIGEVAAELRKVVVLSRRQFAGARQDL
jgi:hypothetical protein